MYDTYEYSSNAIKINLKFEYDTATSRGMDGMLGTHDCLYYRKWEKNLKNKIPTL